MWNAFDIQVDGKHGPRRPEMTWKQLTEGLLRVELLYLIVNQKNDDDDDASTDHTICF